MRDYKTPSEIQFEALLKNKNRSISENQLLSDLQERMKVELINQSQSLNLELKKFNPKYNQIWDLVNSKDSYGALIPRLIEALNSQFSFRITEGIVRALTVKEARGIDLPTKLLDLYEEIPLETEYEGFRWAITNAIWFTVLKKDKEIAPRIKKIIEKEDDKIDKKRLIDTLKKLGV
jgi:hypothetical protein